MLMISRRLGERIIIGNGIEVTVVEIHRNSVRLAVNAAPDQLVMRGEVRDAIEHANRSAAESPLETGAIEKLGDPRGRPPPIAPRATRSMAPPARPTLPPLPSSTVRCDGSVTPPLASPAASPGAEKA